MYKFSNNNSLTLVIKEEVVKLEEIQEPILNHSLKEELEMLESIIVKCKQTIVHSNPVNKFLFQPFLEDKLDKQGIR
jgi:hypothetical protein